jgi:hypothetical protein
MKEVHERIFVGSDDDCNAPGCVTVHACKTCHTRALGYSGSLPADHPNYLSIERGGGLYLNLVDPPIPLFKPESFKIFLEFAKREYEKESKLLIHCNRGESRAPSLALLLLSKLGVIGADSFQSARADFIKLYPNYNPGKGIEQFLTDHWKEI